MKLTAEQLVENWEKLIAVINDNFDGERKEKLLKLHQDFQERIMYMPASYKDYYHSCFPGGYILHVLNVITFVKQLDELWTKNGQSRDYNDEELLFVALCHDLGKVGDVENEYYQEHEELWRKKRGELYMINDNLRHMNISHRSLYLLNHYGIKFNQTEMIAILLHDGLYDEANDQYLITYYENKRLRDNLPVVLHQADMMAMCIERDNYYNEKEDKSKKPKSSKKKDEDVKVNKHTKQLMDEFFK